jgi:hypothetical protein
MQAGVGCYRPFVPFCSLSSEYFYIAPRVEIPHGYIVVFGAAIVLHHQIQENFHPKLGKSPYIQRH